MMKRLLIFLPLAVLLACTPSAEQMQEEINAAHNKMKESATVDSAAVTEMIDLYKGFITQFPKHEQTPHYLEMQAKYYTLQNDYQKALDNYNTIYSEYPEAENRSSALFMKAFIHEVHLKDLDEAEKLYNQFIEEFPEDDFADDAAFSIKNMRMSPEELLEFFKTQTQTVDNDTLTAVQ